MEIRSRPGSICWERKTGWNVQLYLSLQTLPHQLLTADSVLASDLNAIYFLNTMLDIIVLISFKHQLLLCWHTWQPLSASAMAMKWLISSKSTDLHIQSCCKAKLSMNDFTHLRSPWIKWLVHVADRTYNSRSSQFPHGRYQVAYRYLFLQVCLGTGHVP